MSSLHSTVKILRPLQQNEIMTIQLLYMPPLSFLILSLRTG